MAFSAKAPCGEQGGSSQEPSRLKFVKLEYNWLRRADGSCNSRNNRKKIRVIRVIRG